LTITNFTLCDELKSDLHAAYIANMAFSTFFCHMNCIVTAILLTQCNVIQPPLWLRFSTGARERHCWNFQLKVTV